MKDVKIIPITSGCTNNPGCNSQQIYVMPFGQITIINLDKIPTGKAA